MNIKAVFFGAVIFGFLLIASAYWYNGWNEIYNVGSKADISGLSQEENLETISTEHQRQINPASGEASSDFETETFRGGYGIISSLHNTFSFITGEEGIIHTLTVRYGIPSYIITTILALFSFAITMTIIAIIFRLGRSTA